MRGPLLWAGGLIGSLAAHGVAFAFLNLSVEPDPTPTQPKPETQLSMEAYQVDRQDAPAQEAESEAAPEAQGDSTNLSQGAIPQSRSEAQQPQANRLTEAQTPDAKLEAAQAPAASLNAAAPKTDMVSAQNQPTAKIEATSAPDTTISSVAPKVEAATTAVVPTTQVTASVAPKANRISESAEPVATLSSLAAPTATVQQVVLQSETTTPTLPAAQIAAATAPDTTLAAPIEAPQNTAPASVPDSQIATLSQPNSDIAAPVASGGEEAAAQNPDATAADQPPLPTQFAKAALAWNFGDRVVTDPDAIATIQAFMAPQAIDGSAEVRDGLSALLTSVDCARLSATFIPETGNLELRGHVPDNALRAPVLKALQDQIGEGITVTDNLLHLPKPQCGALTGIADVGLPQSTDQLTNKRLIGDNAQAVEYTYSEGQPLSFDLTAPDYDAVVYVDYFDADGQVIHLVPNEIVGLTAYRAKEVVGIERGDGPKLNITIGPPFGQEIAVAFAASRPLYSELRPIIEPAEPYLEFLKEKVAEARETDPDFKGEWVYFFITTQPATQ